jgi:pimeloyl-ACP methyl ester carboxylesterase/DNA-binding CsgD family transcriptional regulator
MTAAVGSIAFRAAWQGYTPPAMPYPIRYARTADGVNVAYLDLGSGEPLIYLPSLPWANAAMMLERPLVSRHPEELATVLRLLPYDPRGCGLSDHDAEDLTLDGFVRDIDAVADAAGLECFALYGSADGSRVAIRYAAERPERVSKLVLWVPSVSPERLWDDPVMAVLRSLRRQDWETYLRTVAHAVVGGWDAERAPYAAAFAEVMAGSMRPDEFPRFARAMREHDVQADLGRVQAPTLVLTRDQVALYSLPVVREVAAGIPGARLVVSPGNWLLPCTDDAVTREIASFMGAEQPAAVATSGASDGAPYPFDAAHTDGASVLSAREVEVLALVAEGMTNAQIADQLVVAPATASRHVHNILTKLGMSRRAEAAAYAAMKGLTQAREPAGLS